MSYRNGNKIAYAAVNGQTGKVTADMPVDIKRYLISSLILAVPLFILFNLWLTLKPPVLMLLSMLLILLTIFLCNREMKQIVARKNNTEDKALNNHKKSNRAGIDKKTRSQSQVLNVLLKMLLVCFLPVLALWVTILFGTPLIIPAILVCIFCIIALKQSFNLKLAYMKEAVITSIIVTAISAVIGYLHPVSDLWYYGAALLGLCSVLFNILGILKNFNELAMRDIPQFAKKGGDDNA